MQSPPAPAMDAASAVAQAIGRILLAMLDALFGDISGLSPRHPVVRAHARAQRHIARYVEALAIALATPGEAPDEEEESCAPAPAAAPHPPLPPVPRATWRPHVVARQTAPPRAPPENPLRHHPITHAQFVTISHQYPTNH